MTKKGIFRLFTRSSKIARIYEIFMNRKFFISCLTILTVWLLISFFPNPGFPQTAKESDRNPARVSGFLRDLVVSSQLQGVKVELRGDGLTTDFHSFTLVQPPRLVIDFPGVLNSFAKKFLEVDHPLLKDIRFGQYPDKLRIVLAFPTKELPPYRIAREARGLTIIVGKIEKVIEEGVKSEEEEKQKVGGPGLPEGKIPAEPPPSLAAVPPVKPADEKKLTSPPEKPEAEKPAVKIYSGERITLDLVNADIRSAFALISEAARRQIVPSAEVQGTISLRLIEVPWDQALDAILSIYSLKRIDEGSIIRILPRDK
jgi:hypothetical protein